MSNTDMLADYQTAATETAIYPRAVKDFGLAYTALGLTNEVGEYEEENDSAELGDVAWYWAGVLTEIGRSPLDFHAVPTPDVPRSMGLVAAAIAGKVKKSYRDEWDEAKTVTALLPLLAEFALALEAESDEHGWEFETVLSANLYKLASRKARNVLTGDGGDR